MQEKFLNEFQILLGLKKPEELGNDGGEDVSMGVSRGSVQKDNFDNI